MKLMITSVIYVTDYTNWSSHNLVINYYYYINRTGYIHSNSLVGLVL